MHHGLAHAIGQTVVARGPMLRLRWVRGDFVHRRAGAAIELAEAEEPLTMSTLSITVRCLYRRVRAPIAAPLSTDIGRSPYRYLDVPPL